jgi:predicted GTPase
MTEGERRVVLMGAGGRDFHDFAVVFRDDPAVRVVAFTAAQIPGIADRTFPASLAGARYPDGIPIVDERELAELIRREHVDEVVFAYSDLSHTQVMQKASLVLAAGADFRLLSPASTWLTSSKPVVAVCASRTGAGKSPTSRLVCSVLRDAGLRVALVRHPMPYGDLEAMRVQRFATLAEIDAADPTIEEREEYEAPVAMGVVTWAGVDYAAILAGAEREADVIVWDGGNNDAPFFRPDLMITVVDPLRPGDELMYHPGETCLRLADVVVVNKVDAAAPAAVALVRANARAANPDATIVETASPVTVDDGPSLAGVRGRGGRPDPDPRRHGLRCRGGGGSPGRRRPRRPPTFRRRARGRRPRRQPADRGLAARGGLLARATGRPGAQHRRRPVRRGARRHPDRPRADRVGGGADPPGRLLRRGAPTRLVDLDHHRLRGHAARSGDVRP